MIIKVVRYLFRFMAAAGFVGFMISNVLNPPRRNPAWISAAAHAEIKSELASICKELFSGGECFGAVYTSKMRIYVSQPFDEQGAPSSLVISEILKQQGWRQGPTNLGSLLSFCKGTNSATYEYVERTSK